MPALQNQILGVPHTLTWHQIGRTKLAAPANAISVSFGIRKYLQIIVHLMPSGTILPRVQFNSDTAADYARRRSDNGGADATVASDTSTALRGTAQARGMYVLIDVLNHPPMEKIHIWHLGDTGVTGAANIPDRTEGLAKWANLVVPITSVQIIQSGGAGSFDTDSEVVVLGKN